MPRLFEKKRAPLLLAASLSLLFACSPGEDDSKGVGHDTVLNTSRNLRERLEAGSEVSTSDPVHRTEAVLDGALPPKLRALGRAVSNLALPTTEARELFAETVFVEDLIGAGEPHTIENVAVVEREWQIEGHDDEDHDSSGDTPRDELTIWSAFIGSVDHFRYAKFKVVRGGFVDPEESELDTYLKFQALARTDAGYRYAQGKVSARWERFAGADEKEDWRIREWHTKHFETYDVGQLFFEDVFAGTVSPELYSALTERSAEIDGRIAAIVVNLEGGRTFEELAAQMDDGLLPYTKDELETVLDDLSATEREYVRLRYGQQVSHRPILAEALGISGPELEKMVNDVRDRLMAARRESRPEVDARIAEKRRFAKEIREFRTENTGEIRMPSEAISVTDLDGDGFDDVFVARNERNHMLRGKGDGTFEDITAEVGLPQTGRRINAALFVDTDNDGDRDLLIGYWDRLEYFLYEDGRFHDRTEDLFDAYQPCGNVAMSAADYDGDGLIDVYVQTRDMFRPAQEMMARANFGLDDGKVFGALLPEEQARRFYEVAMSPEADSTFRRPAPPNMLLRNMGGGKLALAPDTEHLEVYMGTHFAAWGDYDDDGDPDLYVANDFGPNNLFRNDDGVLVDITAETATEDVGFGMGVTWGDYDNDGDQDLYVTNMYSKAGLRITTQAGLTETRAHVAAHGNTLFRNDEGEFLKVSGVEPPALTVEPGGWGWGAQFLDVDNDGYLDIYAPSGYISTPAGIQELADT